MSSIGKYILTPFGASQTQISWSEGNQRLSVIVPNAEDIITAHIRPHIANVKRLLYLFDTRPLELIDDPIGQDILKAIPDEGIIPGEQYQGEALTEYHHNNIIKAYQKVFGVKVVIK